MEQLYIQRSFKASTDNFICSLTSDSCSLNDVKASSLGNINYIISSRSKVTTTRFTLSFELSATECTK